MKTVLIIGGTGAQGVPVVEALTKDSAYAVRVLTRNVKSAPAIQLSALPNVTLIQGDADNESDLNKAFAGVQLAFVNTNGFAIGEKAEIYWGIRSYEIARQSGLEHFVWGALDNMSRLGGYRPEFRCGHYDGKGKVTEWLLAQPKSPMTVSILTSGPYIEMLSEFMKPKVEGGTYVFEAPLGEGSIPFVHLSDLGLFARWIFDNRKKADGLDLQIAVEHVKFAELAKSFTEVTGKPAIYRPITLERYLGEITFWDPEAKVGSPATEPTLQTYGQNFGGFWNTWRAGDHVLRDYALLDSILPNRVKSAAEWMRKVGYTGEPKGVLKNVADRMMKSAPQAKA